MTRQYLETNQICPICDTRISILVDGKCPVCDKEIKQEWLGKKTFTSSTNNHKSRLKLIVNPILRILQFWTETPYVIVSNVERVAKKNDEVKYIFLKYGFRPTRYFKSIIERNIWYANLLLEPPKVKDDNSTP